MTTPDHPDLDEIQARADAATDGPWGVEPVGKSLMVMHRGHYTVVAILGDPSDAQAEPDAEFIAAAREDVPKLLDEVRRLTAAREHRGDLLYRAREETARLKRERDDLRRERDELRGALQYAVNAPGAARVDPVRLRELANIDALVQDQVAADIAALTRRTPLTPDTDVTDCPLYDPDEGHYPHFHCCECGYNGDGNPPDCACDPDPEPEPDPDEGDPWYGATLGEMCRELDEMENPREPDPPEDYYGDEDGAL